MSFGQAAQSVADERNRTQQVIDRSWIAKAIIIVFVAAILAVLLLLLTEGVMTKDWTHAAAAASDLVKSVILPIVTLVLGYYFGQSDRK